MADRPIVETLELEHPITARGSELRTLEIWRPNVGDFVSLTKQGFQLSALLPPMTANEELSGEELAELHARLYDNVPAFVALLSRLTGLAPRQLEELSPGDMLGAYVAVVPLLVS